MSESKSTHVNNDIILSIEAVLRGDYSFSGGTFDDLL